MKTRLLSFLVVLSLSARTASAQEEVEIAAPKSTLDSSGSGKRRAITAQDRDQALRAEEERKKREEEEKKRADAMRLIRDFPEQGIQILNGRYGPYVTDRKKNAKIPKDRDPKELTLEDCVALLAAAPERRARGRKKPAAPAAATDTATEAPAPKRRARKPKAKKEAAGGTTAADPTDAS